MISVIIPGYRHAPYLKERIESVLNQDYDDFEVILLDDKSPDNSAEIMLSYKKHPRVSHVVINETNTGNTFIQWERGINLAKGEYIWIAESDDVADITFLSKLMTRVNEANSESDKAPVAAAFSYSTLIDANSNPLKADPNRPWLYVAPGIYESEPFIKRRLALANTIYNASMVIWRKELYANVSPRFKNCRHCGDWLFWFEICRQGRIIEVPERLNMFRQHQQKVTREASENGDGFRELAPIEREILDTLNATTYQRRVVRGRLTQRMHRNASKSVRKELSKEFPDIYGGSIVDILCYIFDKKTNKSGLQYK